MYGPFGKVVSFVFARVLILPGCAGADLVAVMIFGQRKCVQSLQHKPLILLELWQIMDYLFIFFCKCFFFSVKGEVKHKINIYDQIYEN